MPSALSLLQEALDLPGGALLTPTELVRQQCRHAA